MATRIQLRRDTEANWTSNNPTLAEGEVAISTDLQKIKIGNGTFGWSQLSYINLTPTEVQTQINSAVANLIDSSPTVLNTLNEIAAAINDDPTFFTTVATNLSNHESDTTSIHGISNTANLVYTNDARLTDSRTPTDNSVTSAKIANGAILDEDINASAAISPSKISGTAVVNNDARLSDSRTPTAHAASHGSGQSDPLTLSQSQITNLTTDLSAKSPLASPTLTGTVTVPAPINPTDAATKQYVDSVAEGLHIHESAATATTANITDLSTPPASIDGVTLTNNMRVLVKNQSNTAQNGIYVYSTSTGQLSRASDFDAAAEIDGGDFVFVSGGTNNNDTGWVQTEPVVNVGTDPISFTQFSGAGTYTSGTGLLLTGTVFSNTGVLSLTGTTNEISVSASTGNITLSIPSEIARLSSPTFTGTPAAPTAAVDTNTTQVATTAYVVGQGYLKSATASSTYAPLESPTLTGTPSAITATAGTNTTQIATTAFVQNAVKTVVIDTKTESYTLILSDAGETIEMNIESANNLTIPLSSSVNFPIGTTVSIIQYGAGQTTIVPSSGVTLRSKNNALKVNTQYSGATLYKRGTDEWVVFGDLVA